MVTFYPEVLSGIDKALTLEIPDERKHVLQELIKYIQQKLNKKEPVNLNFICTHNSRRSQFSQIWGKVAATYHDIPISSFSGGVEVTAFNERAVASIRRSGFRVNQEGTENPTYSIYFAEDLEPIIAFSKVFDDPINASPKFAAVMTCSHADENCPFIPGTEARIPVRYEDPKAFDGTAEEAARYDERSLQIASEMFYVFSQISK
ncbi:low molecular weight phosphatase family protein [Pararhodonellum marinum]|uniref:protein-tyrosine-phosphatase n=1 Tax=Pararhodonellum marinum TaxID=2755358 RepID=UPI00189096D6|nr:protein-tyrosine-phosphatase [Pararhodonellum marinum]